MKNFKIHLRTLGLHLFLLACFGFAVTSASHATSVLPSSPDEGTGESAQPPSNLTPLPQVVQPSEMPATPSTSGAVPPSAISPAPSPASQEAAAADSTSVVSPATPAVPPVIAPDTRGIIPPATPLPPPGASLTPVPGGDTATLPGTNVMGTNGTPVKNSGTYYDADSLVPDSNFDQGPRRLDPTVEPAQSFVTVKKGPAASSYEAQYVAASRALKLGRYAAAMEMFEKLYKKNRKDPRILMGLAVAQQGAGFKESAMETYSDLLDVQPNNADAIINLMGIMKDQFPAVTLKRLTDLRSKYPMNPGIPAQIGLVNAEQKNFVEALRYFEIAASMEPRNPSHIYNMAIVVDHMGDPSKALNLYEQALQLDSSYSDSLGAIPREQIYDRLAVLRRKV